MRVNFRSKLFDADSELPEGSFRGEDVAKWLDRQLSGWKTSVVGEDWGWAITAKKGQFHYTIGIYDHDTDEVTENGPIWVVRLFNRNDRSKWFLKLFKNIAPVTHEEVLAEVVGILKRTDGVSEVSVEAL
jgi:hypothetical protein